jgi:magnesium-transporting ATPase (P-type)
MFCKALVVNGTCTALVVAVGESTAAGMIDKKLREKKGKRVRAEGEEDDGQEEEEDDGNQTHL